MAWKHIPDNEEAWSYLQEGFLYSLVPNIYSTEMRLLSSKAWTQEEWACTPQWFRDSRPNYIYLED